MRNKKVKRLFFGILIIAVFSLFLQGGVVVGNMVVGQHAMNEMSDMENECGTSGCGMAESSCINHCLFSFDSFFSTDATLPISIAIIAAFVAIAGLIFPPFNTFKISPLSYFYSDRKQLLTVMKLE